MVNVLGKNVYISNNTFSGNENIVNVDLCNKPWVDNCMYNAFKYCTNLSSVKNINNNVTNMMHAFYGCYNLIDAPTIPNSVTDIISCFHTCINLVNPPTLPENITSIVRTFYHCRKMEIAPTIPDSVTNMFGTFEGCYTLKNSPSIPNSVTQMGLCFASCNCLEVAPTIPDSVTNLYKTFSYCRNLTTIPSLPNNVTSLFSTCNLCYNLNSIPNIPKSVENMCETFIWCTNLPNNIYILSENITNAVNCFYGTTSMKNVYIPFTYDNGVNTQTYNSFINAGYDTNGTNCGVYLKDSYPTQQYNVTDYTYTLTGKTLTLESYTGSGGDIVVPDGNSSIPVNNITVLFYPNAEYGNVTDFTIDGVNYLNSLNSNGELEFHPELNREYSIHVGSDGQDRFFAVSDGGIYQRGSTSDLYNNTFKVVDDTIIFYYDGNEYCSYTYSGVTLYVEARYTKTHSG